MDIIFYVIGVFLWYCVLYYIYRLLVMNGIFIFVLFIIFGWINDLFLLMLFYFLFICKFG